MHNIFVPYISGERDLSTALLLTHVSHHWRKAAHNLYVVWKDLNHDTSPLHWQLSRSTLKFDMKLSLLPIQFSSLYRCIAIPRGTHQYAADLISDRSHLRNKRSIRNLSIITSATNDLDCLIETCDFTQWTSLKSLSIRNATEGYFKLCIPDGAYIKSLKSLHLFGLDGLRLPQISSLETLVLSGLKKIPLEEVVLYLSGLPCIRAHELHRKPIDFTSQLIQTLPALLPADALLCLTSVRIFRLRSRHENTHYLRYLLSFLSPLSTISYLQMEIEHELNDLTTMLRPLFSQHRFSGLHTATFRLIKPNDCDLRGLLNALACSSQATIWLSSHKEFTLELRPAEIQAGVPDLGGCPPLERVNFLIATEYSLQEFLEIATARKRGLKTIKTSCATLHELRASQLWTLALKDKVSCNQKKTRRHAHITCEGHDSVELCLEPTRNG
ncbi:hypothetical protein FIBSPDRAFT_897093 [Athelia psychrophila]|uniref:F-box domain-containing protein n=1 Tax=Athelia psychrophila TaxID=1759441 RepID=A0A166CLS5_9AGAM|nr:hypothetical protein FIBSPDRAFT_897093 [Fibularhizoctonia sp. CBS 109695]